VVRIRLQAPLSPHMMIIRFGLEKAEKSSWA